MYCVRCKKHTECSNQAETMTKNGRPRLTGTCNVCGCKVSSFIKGAGIMNKLINNLPFEAHLPGHNFTGPGTRLDQRLNPDNTPKEGSKPINRVDKAAMEHDICYKQNKDTTTRNKVCDKAMVNSLDNIPQPSLRERIERALVRPIINTKAQLGMGLKKT